MRLMHTRADVVLMRSLRDNNMPKFVYEDVPLFIGACRGGGAGCGIAGGCVYGSLFDLRSLLCQQREL